jgi:hypothetical protein
MTTPADEKSEFIRPAYPPGPSAEKYSEEDEGTIVEDGSFQGHSRGRDRANSHLTLQISNQLGAGGSMRDMASPSQSREQAHRLDDDLQMLQVEQAVSNLAAEQENDLGKTKSNIHRSRSRREEPIDDFDVATAPLHEKTAVYKPPEHPNTNVGKFFKKIHNSSWLVRYITYITPLVLVFLIPLLLGALVFKNASVGGVKLIWFSIWLEIVWLTLWAGRVSYPAMVRDIWTVETEIEPQTIDRVCWIPGDFVSEVAGNLRSSKVA